MEVNQAVKKLKERHPQSLLTIEYLAQVVNMLFPADGYDTNVEDTRWVHETVSSVTDGQVHGDIAFMTSEAAFKLETTLIYNAYIHALKYCNKIYASMVTICMYLKGKN